MRCKTLKPALRAKRRCPGNAATVEPLSSIRKRKLHVCGNSLTCDGYEIEERAIALKVTYDGPIVECEKSGSEMHLENGAFR